MGRCRLCDEDGTHHLGNCRPYSDAPPNLPSGETRQTVKSLRDELAMSALPAIIAATSAGQHRPIMQTGEPHIRFAICRDAYEMADAMLVERDRRR